MRQLYFSLKETLFLFCLFEKTWLVVIDQDVPSIRMCSSSVDKWAQTLRVGMPKEKQWIHETTQWKEIHIKTGVCVIYRFTKFLIYGLMTEKKSPNTFIPLYAFLRDNKIW